MSQEAVAAREPRLVPPGPHVGRWYANPEEYVADRLGYLSRLVQTYGDVCQFRLGLWHVFILNHPDYIRQIFVTDHERVTKSMVIKISRLVLGNGLLSSEGAFHRKQRRLMAPAFHRKRIESYCDTMVRHAVALRESWTPGQTVDVHAEMNRVTLAIIGETMFGADVRGAARAVYKALEINFRMLNRLTSPLRFLLGLLNMPENLAFARARRRLDSIVYGMIRDRRNDPHPGDDILSMLLEARDEEGDGSGMTDRQVRDEVLIIFLAGHETTANALTWTWYLLSQHPEVEARLHEELDTVLEGRTPSFADVPRLQYTRMVLEESIRLYPPAYVVDRHTETEIEAGQYTIPAGVTIFLSPYLLHRDPRFYPDPGRFDPMRWTPEAKEARPKFCYFPFGAGPRVCIGEQFAWAEATLILASIAQRWKPRLVPGHPVDPLPLITLRPAKGMRMTMEPR